ncbi:MAG: hypothetical protein Q9196_004419 [Gyalolechia fulgens]
MATSNAAEATHAHSSASTQPDTHGGGNLPEIPPPAPTILPPSQDDEAKPDPKAPPSSRAATLVSRMSQVANRKIDMTISRLTFLVSAVALVVGILSYAYGAASLRIAEKAYELQQLEFCKDHVDDPVRLCKKSDNRDAIVASPHCQRLVTRPVDSVIEKRISVVRGAGGPIMESHPGHVSTMEDDGVSGLCRTSNPFDAEPQCPPRLRSKGLSRIAEMSDVVG